MKPLRNNTSRTQDLQKTRAELKKKGLRSVQATIIEPNTQGEGLLGIGYLKPLPIVATEFVPQTNSKGNPVYSLTSVQTYDIFFAQYENTYIPGGDEKLYSFVVVRTLNPITSSLCAVLLGMRQNNVKGLTQSEYENDYFKHPVYTTMDNTPLYFRYVDVPIMVQTVPGRLDNLPIGAPNFPLNPSPVTTQQGMLPMPPYPNFTTSLGQTGGTAIQAGGSVSFFDASVRTPTVVQPTSWSWEFGGSASPTGSTAQNPGPITYGSTGSYTVTLTTSNSVGSSSVTKSNFVIVN